MPKRTGLYFEVAKILRLGGAGSGKGSGHTGHRGRPGKIGGSSKSHGGQVGGRTPDAQWNPQGKGSSSKEVEEEDRWTDAEDFLVDVPVQSPWHNARQVERDGAAVLEVYSTGLERARTLRHQAESALKGMGYVPGKRSANSLNRGQQEETIFPYSHPQGGDVILRQLVNSGARMETWTSVEWRTK